MDLGLQGKWALVCGASKGLGLGCAQALVQEGVNVLIVARGLAALERSASDWWAMQTRRGCSQFCAEDITTVDGRDAVFLHARGL